MEEKQLNLGNMADCHNLFTDFNTTVRLTDTKRKSLKGSRRELRRKIKKYFEEGKKNEIQPKFAGQGSFMMDTIINPIPRKETVNGEERSFYYYDIDDGIYFIGNESPEERKSIQTYHNWIFEAVDGHTSIPPKDKNTCIRVLFVDGHNIDLPIYYKQKDTPELAHKAKDWVESDPKTFTDWFNQKADQDPQLRRIVRYLKAWSDYRKYCRSDKKMPSGLILTILAANQYYKHERDDVSLKETLVLIQAELKREFKCERPTTPKGENLLSAYTQKDYFMDCLETFISNAKKALEEKNQKKGCEHWQKSFGDRFPCHSAKDEVESKAFAKGLTIGSSTSVPWAK